VGYFFIAKQKKKNLNKNFLFKISEKTKIQDSLHYIS